MRRVNHSVSRVFQCCRILGGDLQTPRFGCQSSVDEILTHEFVGQRRAAADIGELLGGREERPSGSRCWIRRIGFRRGSLGQRTEDSANAELEGIPAGERRSHGSTSTGECLSPDYSLKKIRRRYNQ